jgi:hypothetical protein
MTGSPEANVRLRVHVADIVARASFMRERQDTTYYTDVANISETTVQERPDRLLAAVARGNRDAFNRWLQWNELDIAGLRRVVQDVQLVDSETLPSWAETICAVVEAKKSCVAPPTLALTPT